MPGTTVVIDGNRITAVGTTVPPPAGARVIDGTGKFLMPGMIDAHIHLRGGRGGNRPAAEQEREALRALHGYLYAGVTTVFDAGNQPEFIMGLRAKEQSGTIVSPRILATGGTDWVPGGRSRRAEGPAVTIVAVPQSIVAQITKPQSPQDAKRQRVTHRSNTFSCCEDIGAQSVPLLWRHAAPGPRLAGDNSDVRAAECRSQSGGAGRF